MYSILSVRWTKVLSTRSYQFSVNSNFSELLKVLQVHSKYTTGNDNNSKSAVMLNKEKMYVLTSQNWCLTLPFIIALHTRYSGSMFNVGCKLPTGNAGCRVGV